MDVDDGEVPTKFQKEANDVVGRNKSPTDSRCGIGFCKPSWLQKCATIQSFVGFNSVSHLFNYSLRMLVISQVTTLEKRFGFNSSESGFILSSSQITFLVFILFFSHYGRNSHIPKILSVCSTIAGLSGLLFATGHFLPLQQSLQQEKSLLGNSAGTLAVCLSDGVSILSNSETCQTDQPNVSRSAFAIFVVAMLIQGAATAPRMPLSGTYIDDNSPTPTKTGKYVGFMMGILTLSPVVAFGMGALSSGIYHSGAPISEIRHSLQDTELTPNHPRWIGAWWLGFLVLGMLTVMTSALLFLFPKQLKTYRGEHVSERPSSQRSKQSEEHGQNLLPLQMKGLFLGVVRVLRNPVFTATVMVGTLQFFAMLGTLTFLPKYLETQFYVPTFKTNVMLGVISLLGNTLGPICGGLLTSRYKLSTLGNIRLVLVSCTILAISCPIAFFVAGKQTTLLKPNLPGDRHNGSVDGCVEDCFCPDAALLPVCGSNGLTYYSPCHAGCRNKSDNGTYTDCTCINGTAVPGYCAEEDKNVYILLAYSVITTFVLTFTMSPAFMIYVRSVSEKDKALALGLSSFLSTLLGHFPGPIVYGKLVDTACIMWQDSCSQDGACALYDLEDLRYKIFGTNMGLFTLSLLCILFALLCHTRMLRVNKKDCNYDIVYNPESDAVSNATLETNIT